MSAGPPALLFDLDGTLVDSVYDQVTAWRATLAAHGIDVASWRIHQLLGRGLTDDTLRAVVGHQSAPPAELKVAGLKAALARTHADTVARWGIDPRPMPGAAALLRHLTARAVRWGVVTGGQPGPSRTALAALGAAGAPLVTAADVAVGKPDPRGVLLGARLLGVDPADVVVVGDSVWDVRAARAAGARGVGVLSGGTPYADLVAAGAATVVDDVAALAGALPWLDQVGSAS